MAFAGLRGQRASAVFPTGRTFALPVAFGDVAVLHWRYQPEVVRPLLLPGTEPDSCGEGDREHAVVQMPTRGEELTMEADRLASVLAARVAGLPYRSLVAATGLRAPAGPPDDGLAALTQSGQQGG